MYADNRSSYHQSPHAEHTQIMQQVLLMVPVMHVAVLMAPKVMIVLDVCSDVNICVKLSQDTIEQLVSST